MEKLCVAPGVEMGVVEKLRGIDWARHGVVYAILFGSALRGERFEDIDIAVLFEEKPDLDRVLQLVTEIAGSVGLPDDRIDLVVLNNDVPCVLIEEALGKGEIVFCGDRELCIDDVLKRLKLCWDFEIAYRKLDLLRTALEAVKRRWVS